LILISRVFSSFKSSQLEILETIRGSLVG